MLRNCYALLLAMLIVTTIAAKPQIVLDKDFSKTDQKTDFAGRGRLAIPLDTASDKPEFYRLDIESRDATRSPVFLSVRGATSPSKTYWSGSLDPNETWTQREFVFQLDPHSEHTSLLILAPQAGTLELRNIKITREGLDDLVERLKRDNPNGDRRRNLCRISRFPLGIQSGWAIDREHSDELMQVEADEKVIGPSGSPALKLSVADSMHTEVAPFSVPWPFINHTASLYVRGKGHLTMVVLADGRNIGATDCDVSGDEWKRISLKFMPAMLAETHQLQLLTSGTIWIDAMQVEPGETATDYDSAYPCEVSLTLPKSETSTPRIQFIDEPAQVTFAVTGKARPFRAAGSPILKSKVINLYGEEKNLPDIPLSDNFLSTGNIKYDVFPLHALGQFRIETWVENATGDRISSYNEIVVTRIRRPRHWNEDAPESAFGIHMGSTTRHHMLAKAIGINWTRLHDAGCAYTCWAFLEPHKGQWTFRDDDIARYRAHHISILGMLGTAPPWATGVPEKPNGPEYWDRWNEPRDVKDYANYATVVATRYKDQIRYWDIWNEPWGKFWSKWDDQAKKSARSPNAPDEFAALQQAGFEAIRAVDPDMMVMGVDTMGGSVGPKWTLAMLNAGALATCDLYDYHYYNSELTGFPGDEAERTLNESFGVAMLGGKLGKPIWMSEGNGANRTIVRGFYHYTLPPTVPDEDFVRLCDYQSRYMTRILSLGVEKIFLYSINVGGEWRAGPGEFQCLVTDDAFAHPQAAAHSALAYELEDTHFAKDISPVEGIHIYILSGIGRSVAVVLSSPTHAAYVLPHPKNSAVRDLFGNDLRMGEIFRGTTVYISSPTDAETLAKQL
jgi:hypothetical protein